MILPFKPLLLIATPILLGAAIITFIDTTLSVNDLKQCQQGPQTPSAQCQPADAIVAISGGDTDARTREAIALYRQGWGGELIFSGAAQDKNSISNAAVMRQQAIRAGIPAGAITIDEQAIDTAGNATGVQAIAQEQGYDRLILVTSPYHQRRASIEFQQALGPNVQLVNHPTSTDRYWQPKTWWLNPFSWSLALSELIKLGYIKAS
jgi:uncharacterized SAM-binding protein YcdF (DUF218 family)